MIRRNRKAQQYSIKRMCAKINAIYAKEELEYKDASQIARFTFMFNDAFKKERLSQESLQALLSTILLIANSKKKYKKTIEEEVLKYIYLFPHYLFDNGGLRCIKIARTVPSKQSIVLQLKEFAEQLLAIKIPRDSFSGRRKGYAIQLLGNLAQYYDVPEFIPICKTALKAKSRLQFLFTVEALEEYYLKKRIALEEEIIAILDKRLTKAKDRTEAMGCLVLQVKTNTISEMEALGRIDTWKEENW